MLYLFYHDFGINFFSYITVRAGVALILGFVFTIYFMPKFIKWAKNKNANQPIYELAPKTHQNKNKIPTMGGLIFIISTILASLICVKLNNLYVVLGLLTLGGFAFIGYFDDIAKIIGHSNSAGFSAKKKFLLQNLLAIIIATSLFFSDLTTNFYLPFLKNPLFDMKFFSILFWILVLSASSNAVNLTDGLDGLATIPSIFSLSTLAIFAYLCGHSIFSSYLILPKVAGVGEISIICGALIGSLLGFLWFNCYPAEVFMGDSGSLSIGAFIGYCGIVTKNEILLILIGFVFVVETLSVILQVGSFKIYKKRIFLMAPLHHHFELKGWVENKIIVRFWMVAFLTNLIALASLKLR